MKRFIAKREAGFTLIELLTVIIIIGVLAAIAIPVFSAQKSRAQDSQTVSDVRNIVTAAETFLADRTKSAVDITSKSVLDYNSSPNVQWEIKGNSTTNGYCIVAFNTSGKDYNSTSKLLSYDSTNGGLKGANGSCGPKDASGNVTAGAMRTDAGFTTVGTPAANTLASTAVGSSTATPTYPAVDLIANGIGPSGGLQSFNVPATGVYKIEAWGASGGDGYSGAYFGGKGAYASGTFSLNQGTAVTVVVGQKGENGKRYNGASHDIGTGGGGGSFVYTSSSNPLVVAGGGSGAQEYEPNNSGTIRYNGSNGTLVAGSGAGGSVPYTSDGGGGGAGWNNPGSSATSTVGRGVGGKSIGGLWIGGQASGDCAGSIASGGYGGGGSAGCAGGGGGGGYTGGNSGGYQTGHTVSLGGSSFVASSTTTTAVLNNTDKANSGNGKVTITRIS